MKSLTSEIHLHTNPETTVHFKSEFEIEEREKRESLLLKNAKDLFEEHMSAVAPETHADMQEVREMARAKARARAREMREKKEKKKDLVAELDVAQRSGDDELLRAVMAKINAQVL